MDKIDKKSIVPFMINRLGDPPIAVSIVIAITVITSIYTWNLHKNFKTQVISQNHEKLLSIVKTLGNDFERHIASHFNVLGMLSKNPLIRQGISRHVTGPVWDSEDYQLKAFYDFHVQDIDALYILDAAGRLIHRYPELKNAPEDYSHIPGVASVIITRKPHLTNIFRDSSGGFSLAMLQPVFQGDRFIGIIRTIINFNRFINQFLKPSTSGNTGQFLLLGDDGTIYYHPDEKMIGTQIRDLVSYGREGDEDDEKFVINRMLQGIEGSSSLVFDELFKKEACISWTYISKNPVISGYSSILIRKQRRHYGTRNHYEREAHQISSALNKLFPKIQALHLRPSVDEKADRIMASFPQVEELIIYELSPQRERLIQVSHRKIKPQPGGSAAGWATHVSAIPAAGIREGNPEITENSDYLHIFTPLSTSDEIWPLAIVLPHDELVAPINRNAVKMFLLAALLFLLTLSVGYIFIYNRNQKNTMEKHTQHLMEMNKKSEELKKSEVDKKKLEDKLMRSEKMQTLGQLAGEVAHDLNNVLSGIVSYPDYLLYNLDDGDPMREHLELIRNSGEKAAAIVQDMLTLTRRGIVNKEILNLNTVITECMKTPEFMNIKKDYPGISVALDLDMNISNIEGSTVHISKSLMNLVLNSFESMESAGGISISTGTETFRGKQGCFGNTLDGPFSFVSVGDTGKGIEAGDLMRIFEPFYTKKIMGRSGTGLGMTVVWGTLFDHSGHIDISSSPGKGTKISLYFPGTDERAAEIENIDIEAYRGKGEKILIVDDAESQRTIAAAILTSLGYRVDTASCLIEAVDSVKKNVPDLVILDMILERGADGLDVYQKLIEINPGQKAIITSGFSETVRVLKAQELGAGGYIKKPYTLDAIAMAVKKALE